LLRIHPHFGMAHHRNSNCSARCNYSSDLAFGPIGFVYGTAATTTTLPGISTTPTATTTALPTLSAGISATTGDLPGRWATVPVSPAISVVQPAVRGTPRGLSSADAAYTAVRIADESISSAAGVRCPVR